MKRTHVSTNEFSAHGGFQPETAQKGYSRDGHYLGITPLKLPNRRLAWPIAEIDALFLSTGNVKIMTDVNEDVPNSKPEISKDAHSGNQHVERCRLADGKSIANCDEKGGRK
jgi:hypothetical protein